MTFKPGIPLDDGEVYLGGVEVIEYLTTGGERQFRVRLDADMPLSSVLGLLRLAEHQCIGMSDFHPNEGTET